MDVSISLPKMGELLVMMMTMISPSRRDVSPAEQLRRSSRLVLPRFRLVPAEFLPERLLMIFSRVIKRLHIAEDGHRRPARGPTRQGRAPNPRGWWVPPSCTFFAQYFLLIPKMTFVEFHDFWSCAE